MSNNTSKWVCIRTEEGADSGLFSIRYDYMRNPRNGEVFRMAVVESKDAVNVLPITPEGKIIMVKQYRFGIGEDTLELPGGLIEKGEEQETAGRRELREETGYTGGKWTYLGDIQSNPVFMNSKIFHWMAEGVTETEARLHLDAGEHIEVLALDKEQLFEALRLGKIKHPHVISALSRVYSLHEIPGFGKA